MPNQVGDMIKKYRKKRGLTQKQLGELCNIADSNIRKYESGRQNPKYETLERIAAVLDVHPLVLLGQISEVLSNELKSNISPSESFISLFKEIYGGINLKQEDAPVGKRYYYRLGDGSVISELTFDNAYESVENVIRLSVSTAVNYDSELIFQIIASLVSLTFTDLKSLYNYALFLESQHNQLPPFNDNNV